MKKKLQICSILIFLACAFFGCALYETYAPLVTDDPLVVDAWKRGQRAEETGEYEKAKEEYYFVKRFATTLSLQAKAQARYDEMSRRLGEMERAY